MLLCKWNAVIGLMAFPQTSQALSQAAHWELQHLPHPSSGRSPRDLVRVHKHAQLQTRADHNLSVQPWLFASFLLRLSQGGRLWEFLFLSIGKMPHWGGRATQQPFCCILIGNLHKHCKGSIGALDMTLLFTTNWFPLHELLHGGGVGGLFACFTRHRI